MLRNVMLKTLRDQRKALTFWGLGIGFFIIITVLFYPSFKDMPGMDAFIENMPEAMGKLFLGEVEDMTSPEGFLNSQLFVFLIPTLFLWFAISRGSGAVAGEEESGTLELLLTHPIKRSRILVDKFMSMTIAIMFLGFVVWVSMTVGIILVDMDISLFRVAEVTVSALLLGLLYGTLALFVGTTRGSRSLSIGISSAIGVSGYLINVLFPIVDRLEPFQKISPFYYYMGVDPLSNGLDFTHVGVLIVATAILLPLSIFMFERRDISS